MKTQFNKEEKYIQEIATKIRNSGNTTMINLYAVMNKNTGLVINYKNISFYTTRKSARRIRLELLQNGSHLPKDVKIVQAQFVNVDAWKTAK
jgi:hypothetical protein